MLTSLAPAANIAADSAAPVLRRACDCGGTCADCAAEDRHDAASGPVIGPVDDAFEREADRMADAVMAGDGPAFAAMPAEGDEDLRMKPAAQRPHPHPQAGAPAAAAALRQGGQPLPAAERAFFEPRFGRDLSHVRIHADARAGAAARGIGARAYTLGRHIAFAPGQFRPGDAAARRLMAHELTHVLQQGHAVARARGPGPIAPLIQREVDQQPQAAEPVADSLPPVPPGTPRGDTQEMDFAFIFTGGAYGTAARAFIARYYPDHEIVEARSFEAMFDTLHARMRASRRQGRDPHLRELVIVTHANAAGGLQIPLTRGSGRNPDGFFNPWSLRELQQDFRADLHRRFRARRSEVVAELFDESTSVVVRGCEFGQAPEALAALRSFFGGDAWVWAPTGFQGYESIPIGGDLLPIPEDAFDFLIEQGYLPPELQPMEDESKADFIGRVFGLRGRIPAQFFVMGREQYTALKALIAQRRGLGRDAEASKSREGTDFPSSGDQWTLSAPGPLGRPDAELDALSLDELEARGRALVADYRPEIAYMIVRLRNAWERKGMEVLERCRADPDPLCGLPPSAAFGDANIVGPDARRFPGPNLDAFELTDIQLPADAADAGSFEEGPAPGGEDLPDLPEPIPAPAPAPVPAPAPAPGGAEPSRPAQDGAASTPRPGATGASPGAVRREGGRAAASDFSKSEALARIDRPQAPEPAPADPQALIDALMGGDDRELAQEILGRMPENGWQLSNYLSASELSISVATAPITFIEGSALLFALEAGGVVLGGLLSLAGLVVTVSESREHQIREHRVLGVRLGYEQLFTEFYGDRISRDASAARMQEALRNHREVISAIQYNVPHGGRTARPAINEGVAAVAQDANRVLHAADAALRRALTEGGLTGADLERAFQAARPAVRRRFINEMIRHGFSAIAERRRRIEEASR